MMSTQTRIGAVATIGALFAAVQVAAQTGLGKSEPKARISLLASVEAVAPGRPFDAAFRFQLAPGWHIYWKNAGDSGLPPSIQWSLPEGFAAGDLQYPVPKRHHAAGGITTNILDGEPLLLARITPPKTISQQNVTLGAKVQYLICATKCIREEAKVRLELAVQPPGMPVGLANDELFRSARNALPKEQSKYLSVVAATEPKELSAARTFDLLVNIDIKPGFHIQSHEPLHPSFIKCDVFLESVEGILFKQPVYPPARFRTLKYVGKVSEYAGKITVRIPGEVDTAGALRRERISGIVKYQACDEKGKCFPPEALAFSSMATGIGEALATTPSTGPEGQAVGTTPVADRTTGAPGPESAASTSSDGSQVAGLLGRFGIVGLLIGCFIYGLALNATPCVLPVLSIKVLGFVQHAHESRRRTLVLGLAFGVGVMLFFVVLGFLAAAGRNVLQYPAAVIGLGAVVMALALSMLGVYTLQVPGTATKLEASIQKEGPLSSFGKGALAPVLGFACTGPLLAGAFGWATQQPPLTAIVAFLFAGLGMASPYVLLGANPNWLSFLPKPGPWMVTFERIMGFLLLVMVIWLLSPLVAQIGPEGLEWTLVFLVVIAMACWLLGRIKITMPESQRNRYRGGAIALVAGAGVLIYGWIYPLDEASARVQIARMASVSSNADWPSEIPWRLWSPQAVERAVRSGKMVFVDFTAAWCTVCKVNKAVAINTPEFQDKIKALEVVLFRGDFTTNDPQIAAALKSHGRPALPLNLIYPAGQPDNPIVLRPNLTRPYLLQKLDEAARPRTASASGLDP